MLIQTKYGTLQVTKKKNNLKVSCLNPEQKNCIFKIENYVISIQQYISKDLYHSEEWETIEEINIFKEWFNNISYISHS